MSDILKILAVVGVTLVIGVVVGSVVVVIGERILRKKGGGKSERKKDFWI